MQINDKEYWSYVKVTNINLDFIYVYPFHVIHVISFSPFRLSIAVLRTGFDCDGYK